MHALKERMAVSNDSLIRRLPLPLLALVFALTVGTLAWFVVDHVQSRALSDIFDNALDEQLNQVSRESLIRFEGHRLSFVYLARLLANHRRLATYLDPLIWPETSGQIRTYETFQPQWLPRQRVWEGVAQPGHLILADRRGGLREVYSLSGDPLPKQLIDDSSLYLAASEQRAFLTTLGGEPYLIVSEPVEDTASYRMGSLVMLVPVNSVFLIASQQSVQSEQSIAAILDADAQLILSSSDPLRIESGVRVDSLNNAYVVTAQSFFEYDDSDLNMLYATLLPRSAYRTTGDAILELVRHQRAIGAASIVTIFVLLFVLLSSRINRLLRRLQEFAQKALGDKSVAIPRKGNQLLVLEERLRDVIDMVLNARDEMRSRHESEIKETETLRVAVMEASLDSIVTIDSQGMIVDFNPTAQMTFGRTLPQAIQRNLAELVFEPASGDAFQHMLEDCNTGLESKEHPVQHELQAIDGDGKVIAVGVTIKPVLLEEQLLFTVYIRDIEEQKAQAAEIHALAAFPEESPSPVLRVNARGVITYANGPSHALLKYWGCRPLQTLPVYWREWVELVLESKDVHELEISTDDGDFLLLLTPFPDLGYVNIYARDITLERRTESELKQRQAELVHVARLSTMGEMSTGIAHELNQPLSAIANFANGCARRLRLEIGTKDELLSALKQISVQATRAAEIIKRLRSLVSRQQPVRAAVELNELIAEVCDLLAHDLRKHEVVVDRKLSGFSLDVMVDAVQIEQALINLVRNALDSMDHQLPAERRLTIASGMQDDGMAYVSVTDNGSGIKPSEMEHLFDAFFTTKESGMGMGLAITQTIVEDHRGRIHADSWPGKGSTFTIELPRNIESTESLAS